MIQKMNLDRKKLGFVLATVFLAVFLILLGPMDYFTHSNVGVMDFPEIGWIPQQEFGEDILLRQGESFVVEFVPGQRHFAGFYVYLGAQDAQEGQIDFTVSDANGRVLGTSRLLLEDLVLPGWQKITMKCKISPGGGYNLTILNRASSAPVRLLRLDDVYIPEETISGNIPLRYAYNVSTFNSQEKILITLVLISLWLLCAAGISATKGPSVQRGAVCLLLLVLLAWNGLYGSIDHGNTQFDSFQQDSEALVLGTIEAYQAGAYSIQPGYSLGAYHPAENGVSPGTFSPYRSQYGLQGAVFAFLSKYIGIETMHLLCSFSLAVLEMLIVCLVWHKYDWLLAGVFYGTFLLSPWITNFARNLYWVEFTWFIPMAAGLFCAWKIDNRKCRFLCYVMAFLSMLIKSLCGYEYVSTIMMGIIQFLLVDLLLALMEKERKKSAVLFRTIVGLGIAAIVGFALAIAFHAYFKGDGSITYGIERIIKDDVLRRTNGGNAFDYGEVYIASLDCSVWSVLCKYFRWNMQIITGLNGNLFPLLCIAPLVVFCTDYWKKKLYVQDVFLYFITFLTSISWFVLAKAHSDIHTHMNYVLWYFGFVQICLYVILKKLLHLRDGMVAASNGCEGRTEKIAKRA